MLPPSKPPPKRVLTRAQLATMKRNPNVDFSAYGTKGAGTKGAELGNQGVLTGMVTTDRVPALLDDDGGPPRPGAGGAGAPTGTIADKKEPQKIKEVTLLPALKPVSRAIREHIKNLQSQKMATKLLESQPLLGAFQVAANVHKARLARQPLLSATRWQHASDDHVLEKQLKDGVFAPEEIRHKGEKGGIKGLLYLLKQKEKERQILIQRVKRRVGKGEVLEPEPIQDKAVWQPPEPPGILEIMAMRGIGEDGSHAAHARRFAEAELGWGDAVAGGGYIHGTSNTNSGYHIMQGSGYYAAPAKTKSQRELQEEEDRKWYFAEGQWRRLVDGEHEEVAQVYADDPQAYHVPPGAPQRQAPELKPWWEVESTSGVASVIVPGGGIRIDLDDGGFVDPAALQAIWGPSGGMDSVLPAGAARQFAWGAESVEGPPKGGGSSKGGIKSYLPGEIRDPLASKMVDKSQSGKGVPGKDYLPEKSHGAGGAGPAPSGVESVVPSAAVAPKASGIASVVPSASVAPKASSGVSSVVVGCAGGAPPPEHAKAAHHRSPPPLVKKPSGQNSPPVLGFAAETMLNGESTEAPIGYQTVEREDGMIELTRPSEAFVETAYDWEKVAGDGKGNKNNPLKGHFGYDQYSSAAAQNQSQQAHGTSRPPPPRLTATTSREAVLDGVASYQQQKGLYWGKPQDSVKAQYHHWPPGQAPVLQAENANFTAPWSAHMARPTKGSNKQKIEEEFRIATRTHGNRMGLVFEDDFLFQDELELLGKGAGGGGGVSSAMGPSSKSGKGKDASFVAPAGVGKAQDHTARAGIASTSAGLAPPPGPPPGVASVNVSALATTRPGEAAPDTAAAASSWWVMPPPEEDPTGNGDDENEAAPAGRPAPLEHARKNNMTAWTSANVRMRSKTTTQRTEKILAMIFIFINRKIPAEANQVVQVLGEGEEKIAGAAGMAVAQAEAAKAEEVVGVLVLQATRAGAAATHERFVGKKGGIGGGLGPPRPASGGFENPINQALAKGAKMFSSAGGPTSALAGDADDAEIDRLMGGIGALTTSTPAQTGAPDRKGGIGKGMMNKGKNKHLQVGKSKFFSKSKGAGKSATTDKPGLSSAGAA
eukprot:g6473.t1